jgi:hypothetical protein
MVNIINTAPEKAIYSSSDDDDDNDNITTMTIAGVH